MRCATPLKRMRFMPGWMKSSTLAKTNARAVRGATRRSSLLMKFARSAITCSHRNDNSGSEAIVCRSEVFYIGEDQCPRCKGRNKAELFADEVRAIRDHLQPSKRQLWL